MKDVGTKVPPSSGDYMTPARRLPGLYHVHNITNFPKARAHPRRLLTGLPPGLPLPTAEPRMLPAGQ
jgi:hypothetical protein